MKKIDMPKYGRLLIIVGVWSAPLVAPSSETLHVWAASSQPSAPYATWATAARTIQEAVDVARAGDLVLVTNGVYSSGGRPVNGGTVTNRVAIDKAVRVESVQGPTTTIIVGAPGQSGYNNGHGDNAARAAYVGAGAVLSGFTLTGGHTQIGGDDAEISGGGALCEPTGVLTNCVLTNNAAFTFGGGVRAGVLQDCVLDGNTAGYGGGAYLSTLMNCTLRGNLASAGGGAAGGRLKRCLLAGNAALGLFGGGGAWAAGLENCLVLTNTSANYGGGATGGSLTNCTLVGNTAQLRGGGAYSATLVNCIVYYNFAPLGTNHLYSTLDFCCTTPLPDGGTANLADPPAFVKREAGDYRLRIDSPCVDAAIDFDAMTNDFLGMPRPVDGNGDGVAFPDIGAYEYDPRTVDSDGDRATDFQEQVMDTSPIDPASCLRITTISSGLPVRLTFPSSSKRLYTLRSASDLADTVWATVPGSVDVPGNDGLQTLFDNSTTGVRFYRVEVWKP